MNSLSFAGHVPVRIPSSRRPFPLSSNRPNPIFCCEKKISSGEPGDPEWMKLAQSIGSSKNSSASKNDDKQITSRSSPQWIYPNGDPRDFGQGKNPWDLWNHAQSSQGQELTPRDPQAETDFWRATARDLDVNTSSGSSSPADGNDSSENVWKMAREVTGDMTQLQDRLRDELNNYDTTENREQYREIARELVGPSNDEPWEDKEPIRPNDQGDAGIGWNPDVDWKRFDDVRRVNVLAEEAAQRRSVEDAARRTMRDSFESTAEQKQSTDDNSFDSNQSFHFNQPAPTDGDFTVDGKMPGFLRNRFRTGTYGSSWSGSDEEALRLQREGVEIRDPQRDTESWRSAAKELASSLTTASKDVTSAEESISSSLDKSGDDVKSADLSSAPELDLDSSSEGESNSWSLWQRGNQNWMNANAELTERNPKKEVDMWRSSARELTSTDVDSSESSVRTDSTASTQGDVSAWDQWRNANDKWMTGLSSERESVNDPFEVGTRTNQDNVDWGSGLGKTNSERSAWDNWNRVAVTDSGGDGKMWWDTRIDWSSRNELRASDQDPLVKPDINIEGEKSERIEKNSSLGEWRSIAKELSGGSE